MTGLSHREEVLSAEMARVAAMKAVKAMDRMEQHTKQKQKNTDRFAQNAWGMLAICCMVVVVSFAFLPGSEKLTNTLALAPVASFEAPKAPVVAVENERLSKDEELNQVAQTAPETLEVQILPSPLRVDPQVTASVDEEVAKEESKAVEPSAEATPDSRFGVDIGGADSIPLLVKRYAALQKRVPALFENLVPIVQINAALRSKRNRLITGPFADAAQLVKFCRTLRLQLTIECVAANYEGQPLGDS